MVRWCGPHHLANAKRLKVSVTFGILNMATKGVWQLSKVTIRYCQHGGSSRYVRQLLSDQRFLQFVEENPQVQFETELKGARHPIVIGDYGAFSRRRVRNDCRLRLIIRSFDADQIL